MAARQLGRIEDTGKLTIGSRGLLITNAVSRKHKEAMQECLTILREHCESVDPSFGEGNNGHDTSSDAVNVEDAIKAELEENKRFFDRFVPGPCLSQNLNVVHFKNEIDVPSTYVRDIFHAMLNERIYKPRFLCRMVPYDVVCKAEGEPFTEALTALVAREFPYSQANGILEKDDESEPSTWSVSYACRNSNALKRQDVLDLAAQLVGRNYRVDLRAPDKLIIVEVVKLISSSTYHVCINVVFGVVACTYLTSSRRVSTVPMVLEDSTNAESPTDLVIPVEGAWLEHEGQGDGDWYIHEGSQWMYNAREGIYFHVDSETVVSSEGKVPMNLVSAPLVEGSSDADGNEDSALDEVGAISTNADPNVTDEEAGDRDISIDFENDLIAATVCRERLCVTTVASLMVTADTMRSLKSKVAQKHSHPIESLEVRALLQGCTKGFEMTDNNFCNVAKQYNISDGSTATISLIYGPDVDGCLKLITAHTGDSRAILCSMADDSRCFAQALTTDHKPNDDKERKYIEKNGGTVEFAQGTWRCVARSRDGRPSCALATSRAIGDYPLKYPNRIVSSEPDVSVYTINFDNDLFLVLVTDGITAVLTNQEIIDIVCEAIDDECTAEAAAERVVLTAEKCGSLDDKTCTVIYFGWHKDLFDKCIHDREEDSYRELSKMDKSGQECGGVENDDMFLS
ncbi:phosphatase 2C domain containing protein [Babesia ovata]|uniref:Phosphatase 2C domain containing protein n=1 Tax=Babesia ovata TaxID=189622 RepID=A0A2H6KI55_9APIC|nr:phosphatase 2C domain containing protein [Babesia ovata]GBE62676.1 phosphatase 2C domain containing protein [Babesia ovata]